MIMRKIYRKKDVWSRERVLRFLLLLSMLAIVIGLQVMTIAVQPVKAADKRVVVLGFDGMDYSLVNQYMNEGLLPNLQRLRDNETYSPLRSTTPPESPVAWSAFVTGTNPGKTGIFDFLRRNPDNYFPELNMTEVVKPIDFLFDTIPTGMPELRNMRNGRAFWGIAADEGIRTVGIMMPMNMPPEDTPGGKILSGLGVPDIRRTMGTYVYYVDDIAVAERQTGSDEGTEMGGRVIEVERQGDEITTFLPGPYNPVPKFSSQELTSPVSMTVDQAANTAVFRITNQSPFNFMAFFKGLFIAILICALLWPILGNMLKGPGKGLGVALIIFAIAVAVLVFSTKPGSKVESFLVNEGEWSEWIPVKYLVTDWVGVEGFFRVFLIEADPEFQMYVTPVSIDPRGNRAAELSYPFSFLPGLLNKHGNFKTYGWDSETWALNENVIDEDVFLADLLENWDTKADIVFDLMKEDDWTLFSAVFQGTDHASHMFWRFIDETHPMFDPEMNEIYGDALLTVYQRADTLVGRVMDEILTDGDELIVMSDHGFQTWHKAVNLNTWLVDNGYLEQKRSVLGDILVESEDTSVYDLFQQDSEFFRWVDWSRSRAYALGLGQIYINLEGRESEGIVTENERSDLIDEIIAGLIEIRDPETGQKILIDAYRADEIYHGDNMEYSPDIVVGFAPGYRVSWQTTLGVAADEFLEVNQRKWSGDHCSLDPSSVLGIFFSTVPVTVDDPNIIDLAPSILSLLGVEKPDRCDGRIIF